DDDGVHRRTVPAHFSELLQLLRVRADDDARARVVEDVLDLPAEKRRIDRDGDSLVGQDGEVRYRPLRPILGEDGHAIAGLDAGMAQRRGQPAYGVAELGNGGVDPAPVQLDRKSTRLNSSHLGISYAVFCLKKK